MRSWSNKIENSCLCEVHPRGTRNKCIINAYITLYNIYAYWVVPAWAQSSMCHKWHEYRRPQDWHHWRRGGHFAIRILRFLKCSNSQELDCSTLMCFPLKYWLSCIRIAPLLEWNKSGVICQDGVDNTGTSKDKLYSTPEDVFKARGRSKKDWDKPLKTIHSLEGRCVPPKDHNL